jgi:hypothetical protein
MLVKSEFTVDRFELREARDPEGLLAAHHAQAAVRLGKHLAERFPHLKDEERSFRGELPHMSANPQHEFKDVYSVSLRVLTEEQFNQIKGVVRLLKEHSHFASAEQLLQILST